MSTGNSNLDLLVKLLGMTQSSSDNEALLATRKANQYVKEKLNTTWEDLLKGRVTMVADPFNSRPAPEVNSTKPPPMYAPRPQPTPAPQPAYTPAYQTPRRPRPQPPQPQRPDPPPRAPAPDLGTGFQARRENRFSGKCMTCLRPVPAGKGWLSGQNSAGQFQIVCGDDFGHNAKYASRSPRPQATPDDLADLI